MAEPTVNAEGTLQGIFVDVQGTLIQGDKVNSPLQAVLLDLMDNHVPVTIFSSNSSTIYLFESAGVDPRFDRVYEKAEYTLPHYLESMFPGAKTLQIVIDDENFKKCKTHIHPDDLVENWPTKWKAEFEKTFGVKLKDVKVSNSSIGGAAAIPSPKRPAAPMLVV